MKTLQCFFRMFEIFFLNVLLIVGKVLNVLCKFSYNAQEVLSLYLSIKSLYKNEDIAVFFLNVQNFFWNVLLILGKVLNVLSKFSYNAQEVLSLYSSIRSLCKNEDIAVFFQNVQNFFSNVLLIVKKVLNVLCSFRFIA